MNCTLNRTVIGGRVCNSPAPLPLAVFSQAAADRACTFPRGKVPWPRRSWVTTTRTPSPSSPHAHRKILGRSKIPSGKTHRCTGILILVPICHVLIGFHRQTWKIRNLIQHWRIMLLKKKRKENEYRYAHLTLKMAHFQGYINIKVFHKIQPWRAVTSLEEKTATDPKLYI